MTSNSYPDTVPETTPEPVFSSTQISQTFPTGGPRPRSPPLLSPIPPNSGITFSQAMGIVATQGLDQSISGSTASQMSDLCQASETTEPGVNILSHIPEVDMSMHAARVNPTINCHSKPYTRLLKPYTCFLDVASYLKAIQLFLPFGNG